VVTRADPHWAFRRARRAGVATAKKRLHGRRALMRSGHTPGEVSSTSLRGRRTTPGQTELVRGERSRNPANARATPGHPHNLDLGSQGERDHHWASPKTDQDFLAGGPVLEPDRGSSRRPRHGQHPAREEGLAEGVRVRTGLFGPPYLFNAPPGPDADQRLGAPRRTLVAARRAWPSSPNDASVIRRIGNPSRRPYGYGRGDQPG